MVKWRRIRKRVVLGKKKLPPPQIEPKKVMTWLACSSFSLRPTHKAKTVASPPSEGGAQLEPTRDNSKSALLVPPQGPKMGAFGTNLCFFDPGTFLKAILALLWAF